MIALFCHTRCEVVVSCEQRFTISSILQEVSRLLIVSHDSTTSNISSYISDTLYLDIIIKPTLKCSSSPRFDSCSTIIAKVSLFVHLI